MFVPGKCCPTSTRALLQLHLVLSQGLLSTTIPVCDQQSLPVIANSPWLGPQPPCSQGLTHIYLLGFCIPGLGLQWNLSELWERVMEKPQNPKCSLPAHQRLSGPWVSLSLALRYNHRLFWVGRDPQGDPPSSPTFEWPVQGLKPQLWHCQHRAPTNWADLTEFLCFQHHSWISWC